jgi:hypothetical protein
MLTEQSFWSMQFKDVLSLLVLAATIVAIFLGSDQGGGDHAGQRRPAREATPPVRGLPQPDEDPALSARSA